jgi:hypothetical protein
MGKATRDANAHSAAVSGASGAVGPPETQPRTGTAQVVEVLGWLEKLL